MRQMGLFNLASSKQRNARKWRLLDIITAAFFLGVLVLFLLVFTPLGDAFAASGRKTALRSPGLDPRNRGKLLALLELGRQGVTIDACPADMVDHMPCEDPRINSQLSREMNYYRERHCPKAEETPLCLIPPPQGYRVPVQWPESLHKYNAVFPLYALALDVSLACLVRGENKKMILFALLNGDLYLLSLKLASRMKIYGMITCLTIKLLTGKAQGWMKREGPYFIFPGGGTMFPDGAVQYIEKLKQFIPIDSGGLRTALDMGCGVASFGGYMLAQGILTLSFAPRDSHKAQIQFALERGVPAFVAMLGTRRLPFPGFSFDLVHCSRCLIPFTAHKATYFLEVDRLLRPGGYLVISGPPVQWPKQEKEWADLQGVARSLCYQLIVVDGNTVIWKKPNGDSCLPNQNEFGLHLCDESNEPRPAWYVNLTNCVSRTSAEGEYAVGTIPNWPERLQKAPSRASVMENGTDVFEVDNQRWTRRIAYYKNTLKIKLGTPSIRNIMDMNAFFGGFAAAIISDPVWVMNVVPSSKTLTLDVIYDRGLIGVYHDWCEPFSTYPRTYDLIHVDDIESLLKDPSSGMSRMLRPKGTVIIRDSPEAIDKLSHISHALRWTTSVHEKEPGSHGRERVLVATKSLWKLTSASH
ncbi:UNVERIFIED_CONTAM: putative methyltransferase PMT13 [Sesamum calycinum]|uniref:Methyltransferase n=1 Tax=Sesamum calycinum TaxID=2727403 RepID=A0AAW2NVJ1_9LAMI